jgi:hypothetical protein
MSLLHPDDSEQAHSVLLTHHLEQLLNGSGISREIIQARGYRSVHGPGSYSELKDLGFNKVQSRLAPGLLVPYLDIDGKPVLYQFRPDKPRQNTQGKDIKYETPAGAAMLLDCGVDRRELLKNPKHPLWITEGAKKGDALRTHRQCVVVLLGVNNFRGKNAYGGIMFLVDWDDIALNGRNVRIVFDSDVMLKGAGEESARLVNRTAATQRCPYQRGLPALRRRERNRRR